MMSKNNTVCKGAKKISESLQIDKSIQKLDIPDNDIGIGGAVVISECVEINFCVGLTRFQNIYR